MINKKTKGKWITGDLHIHSNCCWDGSLSVEELVNRSLKYCDFFAISGHARESQNWGHEQYKAIEIARKRFPQVPIFHTGELEFPIERHTLIITAPDNKEFEIQKFLVANYDRRNEVIGINKAMEELSYIESQLGKKCFMVFNHPNSPDVSFQDFFSLAKSEVFKIIACVDRGERRAPQTWDIGAEWDKLLNHGYKIFARNGSDFHKHFEDDGKDYYPGEFTQDHLWVQENTYENIIQAYRQGNFFCTVDNLISNPSFSIEMNSEDRILKLSFQVNDCIEQIDIISDGNSILSFSNIDSDFDFEGKVPRGKYYRVRGKGKMKNRKYTEGKFEPSFLINPIFEDEICTA